MEHRASAAIAATRDERGVIVAPGAWLTDLSGDRRVCIGSDLFPEVFLHGIFVDKSLLVRDVIQGSQVTLFCRPRRFGKTLAATMLKDFFECAPCADPQARSRFERLGIWEADAGRWRAHQGVYPVVMLSLKGAAMDTWEGAQQALAHLMALEFGRHRYLLESHSLTDEERSRFEHILSEKATEVELAFSLRFLTDALAAYHGQHCVVLIDEYDAPVLAARANGFYQEAVPFIRIWLTNALKTNPSLWRGVLTGVQRISKESIFSGLNNIDVNTPLSPLSDERFGFSPTEVAALATYLDKAEKLDEVREWYDGYRFGDVDIYNPWSVLMYFGKGCTAQPYWANTSGNSVLGEMVHRASSDDLEKMYALLAHEPVYGTIDPNVAFEDTYSLNSPLWSLLYLSGYITSDDTSYPEDPDYERPLRIPNREVAQAFRREVVARSSVVVGGQDRLRAFHRALVAADAAAVERELGRIARESPSYCDLVAEGPCHMLLLGLLFGIPGYGNPRSNREAGYGRYDIMVVPDSVAHRPRSIQGELPLMTFEVKFTKSDDRERLDKLAASALDQIDQQSYDVTAGEQFVGPRLRWGIAFGGKRVAARCERVD